MELIRESELRNLLLEGKIEEFNERVAEEPPDLEGVDLRTVDCRGANLLHANLRNAYLRNADLRGLDLLYADLDGASVQGARVSGVRFPRDVPADEVQLSLQQGTRIRCSRPPEAASEQKRVQSGEKTDPSA
jgi:uncharacterized protein YjbI with pentapeptide repeats